MKPKKYINEINPNTTIDGNQFIVDINNKQERVQWRHYLTRYEAQQDVLYYITMRYNSQRLHSYLGYVSPNQFEQKLVYFKK